MIIDIVVGDLAALASWRFFAPLLLASFVASCGDDDDDVLDAAVDASDAADGGDAAAPERWPGGSVAVQVVDPDGVPVDGAMVLMGGSLQPVLSDADGRATIEVDDDGRTDRHVLAGKRGWRNAGTDLDDFAPPPDLVTIVLERLPDEDNPDYVYAEGGDSLSPNTLYCGHCHHAIADQFVTSRHRGALSNPRTRDLWNGSLLSAGDEDACTALGGFWATGRAAGFEAGSEERCYLGRGVLPDLNEGCGGPDEPVCDARDLPAGTITNRGQCGNCHGVAIPRATANAIDLNDAAGYTFTEGVSCDFCHSIADVTVGPSGGLDGAIGLLRPSQPDPSPLRRLRPISFGPWPDVINPFMGATVQPQFRSGELCSACHEYAMEPLDPDDALLLDRDRFPDGIPIHTTYSEWAASPYSPAMIGCPGCHMPAYQQDTGIGDLDALAARPGIAAGWLRAPGELRSHAFVSTDQLAADTVDLRVRLADGPDGTVEATVTLANVGGGHALPTGEPLRQVAVLVSATIDGTAVPVVGGRAIADVGGAIARGVLGADAALAGASLSLAGTLLDGSGATAVRFVRATGGFEDYAGPGVGWFASPERTPEDKGLPIEEVVEEIAVVDVVGDTVTLEREPTDPLPGDIVYVVSGPAEWAGAPGALYGQILVDRDGARGVPQYRAVGVASDHRIAAAAEASTAHLVPGPGAGAELVVTARAIYRRAADRIVRMYAWTHDDLEIAVATARRGP